MWIDFKEVLNFIKWRETNECLNRRQYTPSVLKHSCMVCRMVGCKWFIVNKLQCAGPVEWSFKSWCGAETVITATLKIMSVRFGPLLCFPLGICSILHSSTNNRSCCSSPMYCPMADITQKREAAEWWREWHLQILSQPALSPCGAKHLTFNYDSRKQVTGMPLTFICLGQFFHWTGFVSLQRGGGLNLGLDPTMQSV